MSAYPPAVQHPGPADKVWVDVNAHAGVILHSMEGYLAAALAELDNESIPLSWHFSISKDGTVLQHYALEQSPWHAGSHTQNARLIGVEHEGKQGEPLTEPQVQASVALVRWIADQCGWAPSRDPAAKTLWEHHEVPGASTTCPNGRIPWERYAMADYPPNTNQTADGFDMGLVRIRQLNVIREAARAFRQATGVAPDLHQLIDAVYAEPS